MSKTFLSLWCTLNFQSYGRKVPYVQWDPYGNPRKHIFITSYKLIISISNTASHCLISKRNTLATSRHKCSNTSCSNVMNTVQTCDFFFPLLLWHSHGWPWPAFLVVLHGNSGRWPVLRQIIHGAVLAQHTWISHWHEETHFFPGS